MCCQGLADKPAHPNPSQACTSLRLPSPPCASRLQWPTFWVRRRRSGTGPSKKCFWRRLSWRCLLRLKRQRRALRAAPIQTLSQRGMSQRWLTTMPPASCLPAPAAPAAAAWDPPRSLQPRRWLLLPPRHQMRRTRQLVAAAAAGFAWTAGPRLPLLCASCTGSGRARPRRVPSACFWSAAAEGPWPTAAPPAAVTSGGQRSSGPTVVVAAGCGRNISRCSTPRPQRVRPPGGEVPHVAPALRGAHPASAFLAPLHRSGLAAVVDQRAPTIPCPPSFAPVISPCCFCGCHHCCCRRVAPSALLDPSALMQLQMQQRKPDIKWLAGGRRLLAGLSSCACASLLLEPCPVLRFPGSDSSSQVDCALAPSACLPCWPLCLAAVLAPSACLPCWPLCLQRRVFGWRWPAQMC
jgi:hypothetical protein